ncbi:MAG TPA: endo-1,3-alpha-glucanase family glycosylhydrolase [Jatrophihabitans sp.]|nr:endo-1,3-alpha-glucanase family glycosylhydrolase [Jatrophihabitans sp.]
MSSSPRTRRLAALLAAVLVGVLGFLTPAAAAPSASTAPSAGKSSTAARPAPAEPLFAFFYQWFDPSSWNRAKIDYPAVGRYSSDDRAVMREQIEQAKRAGIQGFIVSWKDSVVNTRRLHVLADIAAQEHFSLAMIYQGLDFNRRPLPVAKVVADFKTFQAQFAANPVFYRLGGKVLTIFSGTWEYSHDQVALVTRDVRTRMLVLNTEKSVAGYHRIADVTDGDAYYWSSVNPQTNPTYASKLAQLSQAIHADGKYWIAPFAPGFDARLVGGSKAVPRNNGATLRTEYNVAIKSSPDMLGLISWNEFSENTYVEPSLHYGRTFLNVLADLTHTVAPTPSSAADSSSSLTNAPPRSHGQSVLLLVIFPAGLLLGLGVLGVLLRRRRRNRPGSPGSTGPPDSSSGGQLAPTSSGRGGSAG